MYTLDYVQKILANISVRIGRSSIRMWMDKSKAVRRSGSFLFIGGLNTVSKKTDKVKIGRTEGFGIFHISNHFITFTLSNRFHLNTIWGSGFSKSKASTAELESPQCNLLELVNKM